jgi:hypothetical protein
MPQYGLWSVKKKEPKSRPLLEGFSLKSDQQKFVFFASVLGLGFVVYYMAYGRPRK